MHPTQPESISAQELDLSGLWFCTQCGNVHGAPPCPAPKRRYLSADARLESGVRLCACCARVAIPSGSPYASFFCPYCGAGVLEVNRSVGRLVVPLCRDPDANLALLPAPDDPAPGSRGTPPSARFLSSQVDLLEENAYFRAKFLIDRLRLPDEPIPLTTYLREIVQLRHESFHAGAALRSLMTSFHEYLIEIPSESPELAARVREKAREFARGVRRDVAARLCEQGPAGLRAVAGKWAYRAGRELQPPPPCVEPGSPQVLLRLARTIRALEAAAMRDFEHVFGPTRRPLAPAIPPRFGALVLARPGEEWPDHLPPVCPTSARLVVGLEDAPAMPQFPLSVYLISMDRRHRWWILWADEVRDEELVPAPVAWCPRSGLKAAHAAYLLLEGSLRKDRETYGEHRPRPHFGMPGLLDEDLTDVLLDAVWSDP